MIELNQKEVYRYMGFKFGAVPDAHLQERILKCEAELQKSVTPKHVYQKFLLSLSENHTISFAGLSFQSKNLYKNLQGCSEIYLFAATIGIGPDRLISRSQIGKMTDAVIYQAASAAMIESYCDTINYELKEKELAFGNYLRPRFSPGYGDLPLALQTDFTRILNTPKQIGLTLTDTLLMMPSKSVTAVIGVSKQNTACHISGCETCTSTNCEFKRTS